MTGWQWFWLVFIAYWVVVLIWIKGTDTQSSEAWWITWRIIKFFLKIIGGIILIAILLGTGKSK